MKKLILLFILPLIGIACQEDNYPVPKVKVDVTVYLDLPREGTNPFIIRPGSQYGRYVGVNGIVVYEISPSEYYAYDLTCTHNHDTGAHHFINITEDGNPDLECPECQSKFNVIANGAVTKGPAVLPLKKYQTRVIGNELRITN